ncbi:MAG: class IV adenylate cyclase [Thermodesulfobacteriota bacterium]|nr:class IV adenylate cyclase [Thermodesulfobacteriota bacterium]
MPMEHEAKFILIDSQEIRSKILALNGHSDGRFFETNICYEDEKDSLIQKKSILRLRQDRKAWLTHKSPPTEANREVKTMNEIEVSVSDFESMDQILIAVGFHQAQVYEKWRETFILDNAKLCLDTMPFGDFLEIESAPERVKSLAATLGLSWKKRVLDNYLTIFALLKKKEPLPFNDVTFANFKDFQVDLNRYTSLLEAGS